MSWKGLRREKWEKGQGPVMGNAQGDLENNT